MVDGPDTPHTDVVSSRDTHGDGVAVVGTPGWSRRALDPDPAPDGESGA